MNFFWLSDRVYLYLGKEYTANVEPLIDLVRSFAMTTGGASEPSLMIGEAICHGRVRAVLGSDINEHLKLFSRYEGEQAMRTTFSVNQYKRLLNMSINGKKAISAYVFYFIYMCLRAIKKRNGICDFDYDHFARGYREIITEYYDCHPEDEIARFALGCDALISERCIDGIVEISVEDFPSIPRHDEND